MILTGKENLQKAIKVNDVDNLIASKNYFADLLEKKNYEELIHYYIGYADLNLFNIYYGKKDKKNAKKYINDGIEHLEKAIGLKDDFAEGYALLSYLFFNKMGVAPLSMMSSGPKSGEHIKKALEFTPENPRVLYYAGLIKFNTPGMFGGSKEEGIKLLQKSVDSFKTFKLKMPFFPDYGQEEAYAYLGYCYMELDNLDEAQRCFDKVLEINPGNKDVKNVLMKQLKEKQQKSGSHN
jgi:tetratricopeptide (TPR) repeat protein